MLEELAKQDKKWRTIAYNICQDKLLADDLVQDMYMYFSTRNKDITDYYVYKKLLGLFIDYLRKKPNEVSIEWFFYIKDRSEVFEPNDREQEVLNAFEELRMLDRELLLEHYISETSIRGIQRKYNLMSSEFFVHTRIRKAKETILNKIKNGKD